MQSDTVYSSTVLYCVSISDTFDCYLIISAQKFRYGLGGSRMSLVKTLKNRKFVFLLLANTILASAFPIQLVLGSLVGLMLAPNEGLATLPSSVQTLAGLLAAAFLPAGRFVRTLFPVFPAFFFLSGSVVVVYGFYGRYMSGKFWRDKMEKYSFRNSREKNFFPFLGRTQSETVSFCMQGVM